MKHILTTFFVLILSINILNAQIKTAEIVATGLTCSMCSNAINKQLKSMPEVDSVRIDLNTNTFSVFLKKESNVHPSELKDRVEKAGFFVGSMTVIISFDNIEISQNSKVDQEGYSLIFTDTKDFTLNGEIKLKILDKGFLTQKEYKKISKILSKLSTFNSNSPNIYHVKML